jgi:uncharacterized protein YbbC (DUF1343 family)
MNKLFWLITLLFFCNSCHSASNGKESKTNNTRKIQLGAAQFDAYLPIIANKNIGLVINHTSLVNNTHLLDTLVALDVPVKKIFSPEHGFRGQKGAGELVDSGIDPVTRLPIISLYGNHKKPTKEDFANLDVIIFDIQDVGTRFYTYISTMHYVMEACAENNLPLIVLDRPNPNGMHIDGPVLKETYRSFVGMHPIPVLHGCTVGELAQMINGEKWLEHGLQCDLTIIAMENYNHQLDYELPVKPSPNLPNQQSIKLYPSLCFFEGTIVSIGRGTPFPFQVIGHPKANFDNFTFTPKDVAGAAINPKHEGEPCHGHDLREVESPGGINLSYLLNYYKQLNHLNFFTNYFDKLAGTDELRKQIKAGLDEEAIRISWAEPIANYKEMRKKYLLYK